MSEELKYRGYNIKLIVDHENDRLVYRILGVTTGTLTSPEITKVIQSLRNDIDNHIERFSHAS